MQSGQSALEKFHLFNFHHPQTTGKISNWLQAEAGKPLVLTGEEGIGRQYVLQAACMDAVYNNLPFQVVTIGNDVLSEDVGAITKHIERQHELTQRKYAAQWQQLVEDSTDALDVNLPSVGGVGVVLKLAAALKLFKTFSQFFVKHKAKLPDTSAKTLIQDAIEQIAQETSLVIHLVNMEGEPHMLSMWQDITQTLDTLATENSLPGRVLLAVSMQENAPYVDVMQRDKGDIELITLHPYSEKVLKKLLSVRFENNNFSDAFIKLLMWQGRLEQNSLQIYPSQLVTPMHRLYKKELLLYTGESWQLDESNTAILNQTLGASLRDYFADQLKKVPELLKEDIKQYLKLASLCGTWVPQYPLLEFMGIENREKKDDLIDAIEIVFVESDIPLFEDFAFTCPGIKSMAVYKPLYPLLLLPYRKSMEVSERQQQAKELLTYLHKKYPLENSMVAGLLWNIASYADAQIQQEWRDSLRWYVSYLTAPHFKLWLDSRLQRGWVTPELLIDQAVKRPISPAALFYLDAVMMACGEYAARQGGYPMTDAMASSLNNVGLIYGELGDYDKALEYLKEAVEVNKVVLPAKHPDLASSLNNVGSAHGNWGDHDKALEYKKEALEIRKTVLPVKHPDLAASLNNVGSTYGALGAHDKALEYLKEALEIRKIILPAMHPDLASSLNNIGITYGALGAHDKALEHMKEALEINKVALSAKHPDLASSLNNIGITYGALGDHDKALEYLKEALEISRVILPAKHPDLASSFNNIGSIYGALGDHGKALEYMKKALEINKAVLPAKHSDLATLLNNIGLTCGYLGDHDKALEYLKEALEIRKTASPAKRSDLAASLNNIGNGYGALGAHDKALEYLKEALEIWKIALPAKHPDLASTLNNIGSAYGALGDHDKALEYKKEALEINKVVLPPKHPSLAGSLNNIGNSYGALGDHDKALEYLKEALEIRKIVLPPNHPDLASTLNNIGSTYGALGGHDKALEYLKEALGIRKGALPVKHPDLASSLYNIGFTYGELCEHGKALKYMKEALEIGESVLPDIAYLYSQIGISYLKLNKLKKAKKYAKKALKLIRQSKNPVQEDIDKISNRLADIYEAGEKLGKARKLRGENKCVEESD